MALGRDVVSQGQTAFAGEKKSRPVDLRPVRPGRFLARRNQALHGDNRVALKCSIAQFWHSPAVFPSDCLPDVPLQVFDSANFPELPKARAVGIDVANSGEAFVQQSTDSHFKEDTRIISESKNASQRCGNPF